jgi:hypothetical protein
MEVVFVFGGAAGVASAGALLLTLPESIRFLASKGKRPERIAAILNRPPIGAVLPQRLARQRHRMGNFRGQDRLHRRPMVGGWILATSLPVRNTFVVLAACPVIFAACIYAIGRQHRRILGRETLSVKSGTSPASLAPPAQAGKSALLLCSWRTSGRGYAIIFGLAKPLFG